jgi:hypothetical protein
MCFRSKLELNEDIFTFVFYGHAIIIEFKLKGFRTKKESNLLIFIHQADSRDVFMPILRYFDTFHDNYSIFHSKKCPFMAIYA